MNPYGVLMGRQQGPQMQATPVHHENNPAYKQLLEAMANIDQSLATMPASDPTYDEQVALRQQYGTKDANIQATHQMLENKKRGLDVRNQGNKLLNNPALEMLEKGMAPGQ